MKYNIMICTDNNYLYQTTVLIESLILNNKQLNFNIYIIGHDLESEKLNHLILKIKMMSSLVEINYINIEDEYTNKFQISGHISKAAYYRIIALKMLPDNVKRILYLDCDIIVNGNIQKLYNINFEGNLIAAAEDKKISRNFKDVYTNLNLNIENKYFNSGVILFNISELKKNGEFEEELMAIATDENIKLRFHDQDVLNKYFCNNVVFLETRYYNQIVKEIKNKKEANWVLNNSIIIHYADRRKPWKYNYIGYLDDLWWKYERKLEGDKEYKKYRKNHILYKYIPFRLLRKIKRIFIKDI